MKELTEKKKIPRDQIVFFLDSAPIHISYFMRYYFHKENLNIYFNAPYSPAINIIELVF